MELFEIVGYFQILNTFLWTAFMTLFIIVLVRELR